ncbi:MAG TPA: hypothetical protein VFP10_11110, partial [Candidatus Eisenbacteria bacterium]|nr:hypothetical protein [Candidatus Eisenbacteria bacterium]
MNCPKRCRIGGGNNWSPVGKPTSILRAAWLLSWVLLFLPASALAESPPAFVLKWGSFGQGPGQFNDARSVAIDAARGYVYVTETFNARMQKFTLSGSHLATMSFVGPQGCAVDRASNCYVLDTAGNRVKKYSASGAFLTQWGLMGSGNGQLLSPYGIALDGA